MDHGHGIELACSIRLLNSLTVKEFSISEGETSNAIFRRLHHIREKYFAPLFTSQNNLVELLLGGIIGNPVFAGKFHFTVLGIETLKTAIKDAF